MDTFPYSFNDPKNIEIQAKELLHYKRLKLRQQILDRTNTRVTQLTANNHNPKTSQATEATGKVRSVTPASAATTNTSSATLASVATADHLNGDHDYIKLDRAYWKRLVAEGLPRKFAPSQLATAVARDPVAHVPTRCVAINADPQPQTENDTKDALSPSNIQSSIKRTTTHVKRKSPPLVLQQHHTKIAKKVIALPAVAQLAEHVPLATYVPSVAANMNQRRQIPVTILTEWIRMDQASVHPSPPSCNCKDCPYSSTPEVTPRMLIRHNLLLKLWCIEKELYGV